VAATSFSRSAFPHPFMRMGSPPRTTAIARARRPPLRHERPRERIDGLRDRARGRRCLCSQQRGARQRVGDSQNQTAHGDSWTAGDDSVRLDGRRRARRVLSAKFSRTDYRRSVQVWVTSLTMATSGL
jgi:hypothetical protein